MNPGTHGESDNETGKHHENCENGLRALPAGERLCEHCTLRWRRTCRAWSDIHAAGYRALAGSTLVVPCGRATPALFDARNGCLIYHRRGGAPAPPPRRGRSLRAAHRRTCHRSRHSALYRLLCGCGLRRRLGPHPPPAAINSPSRRCRLQSQAAPTQTDRSSTAPGETPRYSAFLPGLDSSRLGLLPFPP